MFLRTPLLILAVSLFLNGCCLLDLSHRSNCCDQKPAAKPAAPKAEAPAPKTAPAVAQVEESIFKGLTIYFQTGSAAVTDESNRLLSRIAEWMRANPGKKVLVEGHVDATGNAKNNVPLAQRRAEKVRQLLIEKGAAGSDLTAQGFGATPTERKAIVKLAS